MASSAPVFTLHGLKTVLAKFGNAGGDERYFITKAIGEHRETLILLCAQLDHNSDLYKTFIQVSAGAEKLNNNVRSNNTIVLCTLTGQDMIDQDYELKAEDITQGGITALLQGDDIRKQFIMWLCNRTDATCICDMISKKVPDSAMSVSTCLKQANLVRTEMNGLIAEVVRQLCAVQPVAQPVDNATPLPVAEAVSQASSQEDDVQDPPPRVKRTVDTSAIVDRSQSMCDRPRATTVNTSKCGSCCSSKPKAPRPFHPDASKKTGWFGLW